MLYCFVMVFIVEFYGDLVMSFEKDVSYGYEMRQDCWE